MSGKEMNSWLLEQINKTEGQLHEKEGEIGKKSEAIKWISGTVAVSVFLILGGSYLISRDSQADELPKTPVATTASNDRFAHSQALDFSPVLAMKPSTAFDNIWWKENIEVTPQHELKTFFPKGSYSPSSEPRGGAGFVYKLDQATDTANLSYKVKFESGFDFVKGGKLPGFCSGDCPRGGADVGNGFSARFMWRKDGDLELYAYIPDKKEVYGKSFGRGAFRFEAGKYYKLEQTLKLNTPGKNDGSLAIIVDGKEVFRDDHVKFRESADTKIDSVLFSTFFGGSDGSYATPKDTHIFFKDFTYNN